MSTKVEQLEAQMKLSALTTKQSNNDKTSNGNNSKYLTIDTWRMTKTEPMIQREGKTWYWCAKHVSPGKYDGLYVTHKPENHDKWVKNRNRFKSHEKKEESEINASNKENDKSLALSNSLKAALLTRCDLSAAQADALIQEARDQTDF